MPRPLALAQTMRYRTCAALSGLGVGGEPSAIWRASRADSLFRATSLVIFFCPPSHRLCSPREPRLLFKYELFHIYFTSFHSSREDMNSIN